MSFLLPDKHNTATDSLLAQAGLLYARLPERASPEQVWHQTVQVHPGVGFDRFVLMLDLLYAIGAITWDADQLVRQDFDAA